MKIAFVNTHPYWGGISNDGGSRTVLLSIDTLRKLGHEAFVVARADHHTWIPHDKPDKKIPGDTDVCIAVSASAVRPMLHEMPKRAKCFWWIRGFEKWQMPTKEIFHVAKKVKCIANSTWLKDLFRREGIDSELCYAGVDIDKWSDANIRSVGSGKTLVGCLYHNRHKTKGWDVFESLVGMLGTENYEFAGFGAVNYNSPKWLNIYEQSPKHERLRRLYSMCHIWFAPTQLEGFHNVPAEAALCGCVVACNRLEANGMCDYANDENALRYNSLEEAVERIRTYENCRVEKVAKMQEILKTKIGDRFKNMNRLLEIIS